MKENLIKSSEVAIMFQKLTTTYRDVIRHVLEHNPNLNDELSIVMMMAHNGMGKILVEIFNRMEVIAERIRIFGQEGLEKDVSVSFELDGENDLNDTGEEPQDEYLDGTDDDEYKDEWELPDDFSTEENDEENPDENEPV